jgi:lambda family phage minor tail protein L
MTYSASARAESQEINPSSIIELYRLDLFEKIHGSDSSYYFHDGTNALTEGTRNIIWAGQTYTAFPVQVEGFEYTGSGQLPQPKLKIANVSGSITTILNAIRLINPGNDLIGAKLTRIRTFARFVDAVNFPGGVNPWGTPDSTAEWPREIYFIIQKTVETRDLCEFTLGSAFDLQGARAPKRQCLSNLCSWVYRSSECGYTGGRYYTSSNVLTTNPSLDDCSKSIDGCRVRFGETQTVGLVTQGSAVITNVDSAAIKQISQGDSIWGFGLTPSSTTVASVDPVALTITVSTLSTSTSTLGTSSGFLELPGLVVSDGTQIRIAESGEIPVYGMRVSGPFLPANEDVFVTSVSGPTGGYYYVNLNISFNSGLVGGLRGTATDASITNATAVPYRISWSLGNPFNQVGNAMATGDYVYPGINRQANNIIYTNTKVTNISLSQTAFIPSKAPGYPPYSQVYIGIISVYAALTPTTSVYTFRGQNLYTIRTGSLLPFGAFPGLSSFLV